MRALWLGISFALAACGGSGGNDAGVDAPSQPHVTQVGPYGNCGGHPIIEICGTDQALCPRDSTGSVCMLRCNTDSDCLVVAGLSMPPACTVVGSMGTFCALPCDNSSPCPTGMQCLALSGNPQCGWGP